MPRGRLLGASILALSLGFASSSAAGDCPDGTKRRRQKARRATGCAKPDGSWHGPYTQRHQNGKKRTRGRYRDGARVGRWITWSAGGEIKKVEEYRGGERLFATFYKDGEPSWVMQWFDDQHRPVPEGEGERATFALHQPEEESEEEPEEKKYQIKGGVEGGVIGGVQGGVPGGVQGGVIGVLRSSRARLKVDSWGFRGGLDGGLAKRFVRHKHPAIRQCYSRRLKKKPKLKGRLTVRFRVAKSGKVHHVRLSGLDRATRRCAHKAFRSLRFPKTKRPSRGRVAFELSPLKTTGWGTIGNIGKGSGAGIGSGYGRGSGRRAKKPPQIRPGKTRVKGHLDKAIIRRIIRRHLARLRFCYERALLKDPKLAGKVTVKFVIRQDGAVGTASAAGVSQKVSSCVERSFKRMRFPKPKGGGVVSVTYPIHFKTN